ncbi:hypothetical protein TraAM80_07863 [Trypanosoma rangeli]|uniref:HECT domain-containing protein n=1 Tax=Trypanosoma rangeli TaxID=5698 RepID=A0A3R7MCE3_TRYRA|nr:uncharacterized protein TraAM80_07863 [Trypanosoma rangeli]RNE99998.1 hypothetical protein TraAM80_07863 [Trypanosoma rangeli]|eukprot:RNE99998.1 hypothetical protein TraAM80_07863 [Trypanosoma rangeli]
MHSREMSSVRTPTFEDIALENRRRLGLMGILPNNRVALHSLMQMMSCMGELSNLALNSEASLSPFEQGEVRTVIGKMAVCLATFSEAFEINVGQAAMDTLRDYSQKADTSTIGRSRGDQKKTTLSTRVAGEGLDEEPGSRTHEEPNVLLSPTSNRDFFRFLDELVTYSRSDFEKAELKWVAPLPDGTIQDLIENGSSINVQYKDLPLYLECVQRYRNARTNEAQGSKTDAEPSSSATFQRARTIVSVAPGKPHYKKESLIVSPHTTMDGGPMSPSSLIFPTAPDTSIPRASVGDSNSAELATSEADFRAKVDRLKQGQVTGSQIAQLNLTFSVPQTNGLLELIPNGIHVKVTSANVGEFLRLLGDKSGIQNGKIRRMESIKKLEVSSAGSQDISRDKEKFSPTHFSKGIFAPYDERTSFFVDVDASDELLPAFIKDRESQRRGAETPYVRVIRKGDLRTWRMMIDEVQKHPSAIKEYGVTFCVPATIASHATEEEQATKVHELIKDGASTLVDESQVWLFSRLIEQFLHPNA